MLKTLRNAFKIPDLRNKIIYTALMIAVIRLGAFIFLPGTNPDALSVADNSATSFLDAITGGSLNTMTIFALGVMPYITSSIVMNLLTIAIPKLEEMQKEGEDGRKKIAEITRYVTIILALIEGTGIMVSAALSNYLVEGYTVLFVIVGVIALTAGSAFTMWVGERITEKGIGNGISIILMVNILSRIPFEIKVLWSSHFTGRSIGTKTLYGVIGLAILTFMVGFVVLLQNAERRIPAQYAKRVQGRKTMGGQSTHIPLKVNTAGVIPVIFASSLLSFPGVIVGFLPNKPTGGWATFLNIMNQRMWSTKEYWYGAIIYITLIIFFAYFYTSISFNPIEVANNMKKSGGFIPGIRPGKTTVDYLKKVVKYIVFIGAMGLVIVAVIPILLGVVGIHVSFSGTSLIIIVGVVIETIKQAESQMLVRHYKGFLNA
ncbi:MAG: protein translocase subunit secY/sec61 alpha [Clostridiales bacterium]|jgi:preprotein translocase subunit SecY|nr:protein translocase subunit secY/sec61 alpha [Clostridiales bacterium]